MNEIYKASVVVESREDADEALLKAGEAWFGHRNLRIANKRAESNGQTVNGTVFRWKVTAELTELPATPFGLA